MIRLMFVDDNRIALEYYANLIDYRAQGFELVCMAGDGESALILFRQYLPQVVITDVQMPNMSGIELTRQIRTIAPETIIIFLSSYEEFKYIHSAMQLGVYDYLLKHEISKEKLIEKLEAVHHELEHRRFAVHYIAEGTLSSCLDAQQCSAGRDSNMAELLSRFPDRYNLTLVYEDGILPILAQITDLNPPEAPAQRIQSFFYDLPEVEIVLRRHARHWLILSRSSVHAINAAYQWQEGFYTRYGDTITSIVLAQSAPIAECIQAYRAQADRLEQKFFYPPRAVLTAAALRPNGHPPEIPATAHIAAMLETGRAAEVCRILEQLYAQLRDAASIRAFDELVSNFGKALMNYSGRVWDAELRRPFSAWVQVDVARWQDIPSAFVWLKERYAALARLLQKGGGASPAMAGIYTYIEEHYQNSDLSAEDIAGAFHLSVNRANALVKRETGNTLWKLLIQLRMEKARELLDRDELPISSIVERVGYKAISHFSDSFKQYYGITPSEYRRRRKNETI